jgi:DNA (cytosine-5)-methyltransferase 1
VPTPPIRVAELFAGVGGFRKGLEGEDYEFVFSNQWEPNEIKQWASKIYVNHFGETGHSNDNIQDITSSTDTIREIPDHELLVGGFPCQDYSVARTISGELGIEGLKGRLWLDIERIIREKKPRPKVIMLENVPRLLNSPANSRGLNFSIILNNLLDLGYDVEWRVINAADYGMPQKRKRVFILAYREKEVAIPHDRRRGPLSMWLLGKSSNNTNSKWKKSPFAETFPVDTTIANLDNRYKFIPQIPGDISEFSTKSSPFGNTGYAYKKGNEYRFWSTKVKPQFSGERQTLGDILLDDVDRTYEIIDEEKIRMYDYIKGPQKEWRIRKIDRKNAEGIDCDNKGNLWDLYQKCTKSYRKSVWAESRENSAYSRGKKAGIIYDYSAGGISFPDKLHEPSRTVVTSEIGKSVSRMRHVIKDPKSGNYRGLMPEELEQLNMFPKGWTEYDGISASRRGFLMGNALVVGIIEKLAGSLSKLIRDRSEQ